MEPLSYLVVSDDCKLDGGATAPDEVGQVLLAEKLQVFLDAEARPANWQLTFGRPCRHVASASRGRRPLHIRPDAFCRASRCGLGSQRERNPPVAAMLATSGDRGQHAGSLGAGAGAPAQTAAAAGGRCQAALVQQVQVAGEFLFGVFPALSRKYGQ